MILYKGRTAARPDSRASPFTYPRARPLGYLPPSSSLGSLDEKPIVRGGEVNPTAVLPFHPIPAMIAHRSRHIAMTLAFR